MMVLYENNDIGPWRKAKRRYCLIERVETVKVRRTGRCCHLP